MTPYILQVAVIIAGCLAFYKVLLQKETFYRVNRYVLLTCLVVAFALPLVPVPQQWSFRVPEKPVVVNIPATTGNEQTKQVNAPVTDSGPPPSIIQETTASPQIFTMERVLSWVKWLYWFGVAAFGLNFLVQVVVLFYRAYKSPVIIDGRYRIVEISGDKAPCSFANNIFINPEKYEWDTYNQILLHEKVHIRQKHSMDLLLAELVLIFQWFNPFAWLYRKEMENNLEFLTDDQLVQHERVEKTSYQMSLLKVSSPQLPLSLTTNYNQSLLKKRIAMMNTKQSNLHTAWKYFFLLPVLVLFASLLNDPIAQENKKEQKDQQVNVDVKTDVKVAKDIKTETNVQQDVQTDTRQQKKVNVNVNANVNSTQNANVAANANSNPNGKAGRGMELEGAWFGVIKGDRITIQFKDDENEGSTNSSSFDLSEFANLPRGSSGTFKLTREAGTMEFTGKFDENRGMGTYKFIVDKQYMTDMGKDIDDELRDKDVMVFWFINIKRSYVKMLKDEGYTDIGKNDVIPMAALKIESSYIRGLKAAGLKQISMRNLIPLKSLEVDGAYIQEIRDAGYKDVDAQQLITFKSQGIDGAYIKKMLGSDRDISMNDLVALKSLKIDDEYINSFKQVGFTNISSRDIIPMKSLGITAEYAKSFQNIGYTKIQPRDLIPLMSQKITPEFITGFAPLGYKEIPIQDVISLKAVGVTPGYVKEMQEKGFKYDRLNKYISLKSISEH
jgi:hypothetical protein